jgi:peroxiredoxin
MTATDPTPIAPDPGDDAPDFTLASTSGESVTLSSFRGRKVLLAFFPLAFTSTCTAELCDMRDDWSDFEKRNIAVLPISVDSVPTLKEFRNKHGMQVHLLSDFMREVSRSYGVLNPERFTSRRAYFVIDKQGKVRWKHVETVSGQKRSNKELLERVDAV